VFKTGPSATDRQCMRLLRSRSLAPLLTLALLGPAAWAGASAPAPAAPGAQVSASTSTAGTSAARKVPVKRTVARKRTVTTPPKLAPVAAPRMAVPTGRTGTTTPAAAAAVAVPSGPHSFLNTDRGRPTRWNPCAPVPWLFSPAGAPAGGLATVQAAVATLSKQTGLTFRYEGTTTRVPDNSWLRQSWGSFQPLLIGWTTAGRSDLLAGQGSQVVGMARVLWTGSYDEKGANHTQIATAVVALNAASKAGMSGPNSWYTFALHELGHAMGLGHVDDPNQLMRASIPAHLSTYGPGDRAGLHALGASGGCLPAIR
jgi:hypothetical protein